MTKALVTCPYCKKHQATIVPIAGQEFECPLCSKVSVVPKKAAIGQMIKAPVLKKDKNQAPPKKPAKPLTVQQAARILKNDGNQVRKVGKNHPSYQLGHYWVDGKMYAADDVIKMAQARQK